MTEDTFRRFSECLQVSRDFPGLPEQRAAAIAAMAVVFGSNQHRLLQKVDQEIGRRNPVGSGGRTYLPIAFADTGPYLAFAGATGIVLSQQLVPSAVRWILPHEFAHSYEQLGLLTQDDKSWFMAQMSTTDRDWRHHSETFADAFRDWWHGAGWDVLTPRLLR